MISSEHINRQLETARNYARLGQLEKALETCCDIPEDIIAPDISKEINWLYSTAGKRTHAGLCILTNYICSELGLPEA